MYRVAHQVSFLSRDGHDVVCVFDSPDAEAVRAVLDRVGDVAERLWPATAHAAAAMPAEVVVVERDFDAPVSFDDVQALETRGAWCLEQHRVQFLHTLFALDRRRMLCLYAAPDAESVRLAQAQAGMPVTRVWPAQVFAASRSGSD